MLWIGARLGALERACMLSVLRQEHSLTLWTYEPVDAVPAGVEQADAAGIVPASSILRHSSGSVSLFSNWFRYELQRRGLGTWLDSDVYLLQPIEMEAPYLLIEEARGWINGGILRMPSNSPALPPLVGIFERPRVPRWLPLRTRVAAHLRRLRTGRTDLSRLPWGSCGPRALTAVARRCGLASLAHPPEIYSPVPWQEAEWIADPAVPLERWTGPSTRAVHLWNERIKHLKDRPAPPGSFLHRLQQEGA